MKIRVKNYQEKNNAYKEVLGLFRANYGRNLIKISNESLDHFRVKCEVCMWLWKNGWDVYTECTFKSGGRADVVGVHKNGDAYIFEVLKSETEKRFNEKNYPLPIIKVYVKDWDYSTFGI